MRCRGVIAEIEMELAPLSLLEAFERESSLISRVRFGRGGLPRRGG